MQRGNSGRLGGNGRSFAAGGPGRTAATELCSILCALHAIESTWPAAGDSIATNNSVCTAEAVVSFKLVHFKNVLNMLPQWVQESLPLLKLERYLDPSTRRTPRSCTCVSCVSWEGADTSAVYLARAAAALRGSEQAALHGHGTATAEAPWVARRGRPRGARRRDLETLRELSRALLTKRAVRCSLTG